MFSAITSALTSFVIAQPQAVRNPQTISDIQAVVRLNQRDAERFFDTLNRPDRAVTVGDTSLLINYIVIHNGAINGTNRPFLVRINRSNMEYYNGTAWTAFCRTTGAPGGPGLPHISTFPNLQSQEQDVRRLHRHINPLV